ncbi:TonB-dependent receptor [Sphingosinicellaceae bacterium]|nr:TonB-dependent receptor [Sphingosinicellaceae bacterium]
MIRSLTLAGTALFALAASTAFAQAPAAPNAPAATSSPAGEATADAGDTGDIIVTAQKRSERLQDVPVAVSVISGDALAAQGKVSLEGAQYLVPSFNFLKSGTTLNQSLFLRGVGTATFSIAGEPSVSTVLDGVVFSRAGEAFSDLVDIERIEVLRGPQGTLFGKNSSAGVINIVSKRPGKELGGYVEGGYYFGNGNEYRVRGALDVPLSANIRSRITGFYDKYDGNIHNVAPDVDRRVNGFKHYGARGIIEADASDTVKLTFIADYHHNNDDCCAEVIAGPPLNANGTVNTAALALIQTVLPTIKGTDTRSISQNLVTQTKETGYGFSGQADVELGDLTVTSITAYRNYKNTEIRDGDFLPQAYVGVNQLHDFGPQTGNTFSQELRLTSPGHQFFDYVAGFYYSRAESERIFTRNDQVCTAARGAGLPAGVLTPCTSPLAAPSTFPTGTADFGSVFKNVALFGQGTLNIATRFRLIGGVRYTIDQLDVFHSRVTTLAGPGINGNFDAGVYNNGLGGGVSNGVPFRARATNDNWSGKAGAQFDVSEASTAYATYSRGYKGPAFNVFYNLTYTGTNEIAPETSNAYEIGLKNTLFDGKLTLNLAGYYAKYHNFQANNPDLAAGVVVTRFTNAGDVSTRGGELDAVFRAGRDLNFSGGVAYTDAHVDKFKVPNGNPTGVIPSGTPLGFAPKWKGNVGADYRLRTGGAVDFGVGAQASYQSKELSLFSADPVQRAAGTIQGYGLINLSASVMDKDDHYKLTFQVRNLTDKSFAASIINGGPSGGYRYQIPRDADRYYGVTGRVSF